MTEFKTLGISDLKKDDRIFVINNLRSRGELQFQIKSNEGEMQPIILGESVHMIPFCITDLHPAEVIINSTEFRSLLSSEGVLVVDEETAKQLLSDPEVLEEAQKIHRTRLHGEEYVTDKGEVKTAKPPRHHAPVALLGVSTGTKMKDWQIELSRSDLSFAEKNRYMQDKWTQLTNTDLLWVIENFNILNKQKKVNSVYKNAQKELKSRN